MSISFCPFCGQQSLVDCDGEGYFFCPGCRHDVVITIPRDEPDPLANKLFDALYPDDSAESAGRDMQIFGDIEGGQS